MVPRASSYSSSYFAHPIGTGHQSMDISCSDLLKCAFILKVSNEEVLPRNYFVSIASRIINFSHASINQRKRERERERE